MAKKKETPVKNEEFYDTGTQAYNFPEYSITIFASSMEKALELFEAMDLREKKN